MGVQSHDDSRVIMGSGQVRQQLMAPAAALSELGPAAGGGGERWTQQLIKHALTFLLFPGMLQPFCLFSPLYHASRLKNIYKIMLISYKIN